VLPLAALLAALLGGCVTPQPRGTAADGERLLRERFDAMTRADLAALRPLLAPDLAYCHSDGRCETRDEFLSAVAGGQTRYRSMTLVTAASRAEAGTLVTRGVVDVDGERAGAPMRARLAFLEVQARRDGAWRLLAWQSARLPNAP
jgi:ketosteroid isomerase-like protein